MMSLFKKLLNDLKCLFSFEEHPTTPQKPLITPVHLQPKVTIEPEGKEPPEIKNRLNEIKWDDWHKTSGNTLILSKVKVAGVTFNNPDGVGRQKILSHMEKWEVLDIVREPDNQFDPNALLVISGMGVIGHIEKNFASIVSPLMAKGASVFAKLSGLYGGQKGKNYGATVEMHILLPDTVQYHCAKVVGITGKNDGGDSRSYVASQLKVGDQDRLYGTCDNQWRERVDVETEIGDVGKLGSKGVREIFPLLETGYKHIAIVADKSEHIIISACFWQN